jgi:hypothetical protein
MRRMGECGLDEADSGQEKAVDSCEHGNKKADSVTRG